MSGPAEVRSTVAVESFASQLASYRQRSEDALDGLQGQLRRFVEWLEQDRPAYWKGQVRLAETTLHEAKHRLQHCLMTPFIAGERPACQEEKDAVAAAGRRLAHCREKFAAVKKWQQTIEHELLEYQGRVGALRQMLDADLVRAQGVLNQIVIRLERYAIEQPGLARHPRAPANQARAPAGEAPDPAQRNSPNPAPEDS